MWAVLRRRDFSLLWFSGLVSVAGDWVLLTALPYFVYVRTGSTLATAGMTAAELAPAIVLSSVAGVFVDRWNRARLLLAVNVLQAVTVAALLAVPHGLLWVVFAVAMIQSALSAFSLPAESSLLPTLVPAELLVAANALNSLNNRLGRLAGVPAGAALYASLGLEAVIIFDVVSFLLAAALIHAMTAAGSGAGTVASAAQEGVDSEETLTDTAAEAETAVATFWGEWLDGLRAVRDDHTIAVLFLVFGLMTFGGTMLDPLSVPWIRDVLDRGVGMVAVLSMVHSVAGIVGSFLLGATGSRWSPRSLIAGPSIVAGSALLVRFNVPVVWVAVALTAISGLTSVATSVGVETLAQERVPDRLRGRVFGSLQGTIWLLSLLGAALGGILGEVVGILPALDVASGLVLLAGLVVVVAIRPRQSLRTGVSGGC